MIVVRWLIACAVTFGGLAWATRLVRRVVPAGGGSRGPLARLGALSLGPRRALVVIKVGDDIRGFLFHEHGVLDTGPVTGWPAEVPAPAAVPGSPPTSWLALALGPKATEMAGLALGKLGRLTPRLASAAPPGALVDDHDGEEDTIPTPAELAGSLPPYGPDHPDWIARERVLERGGAAPPAGHRPRPPRTPATPPKARQAGTGSAPRE